jgi:hypothetical protein
MIHWAWGQSDCRLAKEKYKVWCTKRWKFWCYESRMLYKRDPIVALLPGTRLPSRCIATIASTSLQPPPPPPPRGRQCVTVETRHIMISSSQWQLGLKNILTLPSRTLGSWVQIPLEAFIHYSVSDVLCVSGLVTSRSPPYKVSYRLCKGSWNWESGQGPTKYCRVINELINELRTFNWVWIWNGVHSASWVQLRSYLIEK